MKLELETDSDLSWAFAHNDGVTTVRISANLARLLGIDGLCDAAGKFPQLEKLIVADDYFQSQEMALLAERLQATTPFVKLEWTYDLKVDGKHGR